MNLFYFSTSKSFTRDTKVNKKIERLINKLNESKYVFSEERVLFKDTFYYNNVLPFIPLNRDILEKGNNICQMRVNWLNKPYSSVSDMLANCPLQYGFQIAMVDSGYKRNKYQNKENAWVIFDKEDVARDAMKFFNSFFITSLEMDAVEEYKKFKENPDKRPLTFDQVLGPSAYDLYEQVDNGEL